MSAVSYSGIGSYNQCPSRFKRRYVTKEIVKEPPQDPSSGAGRGLRIHQSVEDCLSGKTKKVDPEIQKMYGEWILSIAEDSTPELEFAFNNMWERVAFDDPEAMIRGFIDNIHKTDKLVVHEWKTGKVYDTHADQRALYALACLLIYPEFETVEVICVYFDQGKNVNTHYNRAELATYKWMWERKINKTKPPQAYPMRPGWYCGWCPYSSKKGFGGKCPN